MPKTSSLRHSSFVQFHLYFRGGTSRLFYVLSKDLMLKKNTSGLLCLPPSCHYTTQELDWGHRTPQVTSILALPVSPSLCFECSVVVSEAGGSGCRGTPTLLQRIIPCSWALCPFQSLPALGGWLCFSLPPNEVTEEDPGDSDGVGWMSVSWTLSN